MPWVKLDDRFHDDPRVKTAFMECQGSVALHVMALTYSAAHLLDGHIPEVWVKATMPAPSSRRKAVAALVDAGLWAPENGGWLVRNYLKFNPSRAQVEEQRARDAERKARGRSSVSRLRPVGIREDSA